MIIVILITQQSMHRILNIKCYFLEDFTSTINHNKEKILKADVQYKYDILSNKYNEAETSDPI